MKKIQFALLALATICMIACKKSGNNEPTNPDPEDEYICPITIDGVGDEYDALPNVIIEKHHEGCSSYPAAKTLKVYSDEVYTNLYIEFDPEEFPLAQSGEFDSEGNVSGAQFHIYFAEKQEDDPSVIGYRGEWTTPMTLCLEGTWMENQQRVENLTCDQFVADPLAENPEWPWGEGIGTDPIVNSVVTENTMEIQLKTLSLALKPQEKCLYISIDLQDAWESVGILPNANDEDVEGLPMAVKVPAAKMIINEVE